MTDPYLAFLDTRGTRTVGAAPSAVDALRNSRAIFPHEVIALLTVQDGEDGLRTFAKGVRFISASEMLESLNMLRTMVHDDETLPSCMLDFVPFITTDICSDVGVFSDRSPVRPGCVAELLYETGELIWWASSVDEFLARLSTVVHSDGGLGFRFPAIGMTTESIHDLPGWPEDSE